MKKKTDKELLLESFEKIDSTFKRRIEENMAISSNEGYHGITKDTIEISQPENVIRDTGLTENSQLPPELQDSEGANVILSKINDLLDLLNDPDIDQSEGGVSDQMRKMALHMINTNR